MLNAGWRVPSNGFLKINVDGSYRDADSVMGGGGLLRSSTSTWVGGFMLQARDGNPLMAEASAMRAGLLFSWDNDVRRLICESDCLELVKMVTDHVRAQVLIHGSILRDIWEVLDRDWQVHVCWCSRESNSAADWLARRGSWLSMEGLSVLAAPPPELDVIVLRDSLGLV